MLRQNLILMTVLCFGALAGHYLPRGDSPSTGSRNADAPPDKPALARPYHDSADATLARLQRRVAQTEQEYQWLAERVAMLEGLIEQSEVYLHSGSVTPVTATNGDTAPDEPAQSVRSSVATLIATGIPAEQAATIQARLDAYDLRQLYLQDRARREGWFRSARYRKEQLEARNAYKALRPEIGDDAYDRMLYALGHANRVVVRDTMRNSSAEQYGLQTNDRIIEYDGQRVFTAEGLNDLVTRSGAGTLVLVRVQRSEQQLDLYLPRGPIGIRLASNREQP
jgi:C-terminal processing protease CtpA/Prc